MTYLKILGAIVLLFTITGCQHSRYVNCFSSCDDDNFSYGRGYPIRSVDDEWSPGPPCGIMGLIEGDPELRSKMNAADREYTYRATQAALENGGAHLYSRWRNPSTGNQGRIVATGVSVISNRNMVCRDYKHIILINGQEEYVRCGRGCRDYHDIGGIWIIQ